MMKLISLNTWGGRVGAPMMRFVEKHAVDTDIFCFQEVNNAPSNELRLDAGERPHLFTELQVALLEHDGYFVPQVPGAGVATFVQKSIGVSSADSSIVLFREEITEGFYPRPLQHVAIKSPVLSVYNFHGVPKSDKLDTPARELQTKRMLEIMGKDPLPKILVGDFNLRPETSAIGAFEKHMKNLVIEGGFTTTRSELYAYKFQQPFADYAFVSPEIEVKNFQVLSDEVSDHLPLTIEFEIVS